MKPPAHLFLSRQWLPTFVSITVSITILMASFMSGCVKSQEPEIAFHPTITEDKAYFSAYDRATSQYEVINNFETRLTLQATLLSSEFRNALISRYQMFYQHLQTELTEQTDKTAFFVSIYAANEALNDLSDSKLWSILLQSQGQTVRPKMVKKLKEKARWQPFFKGISPWSSEYLIVFDMPAPINGTQDLNYTKLAKLVLSNQDALVSISW